MGGGSSVAGPLIVFMVCVSNVVIPCSQPLNYQLNMAGNNFNTLCLGVAKILQNPVVMEVCPKSVLSSHISK